jgi:hypothetical protein
MDYDIIDEMSGRNRNEEFNITQKSNKPTSTVPFSLEMHRHMKISPM